MEFDKVNGDLTKFNKFGGKVHLINYHIEEIDIQRKIMLDSN